MESTKVQPKSPWILYFDGATRDTPGSHGGIGAVLKDARGHTVVELKKFIGSGVSSGVAKYKALVSGLKKAASLGVEYLLVKGDSKLVHNQVVGHSLVQDKRLLEYQQKVLALTGEFKGVFAERISREDNARADRLANEAIDEELQIVDNLSEYIDQEWSHTCAGQSALPSNLHIKPVASVSPHVVKVHGTTANSKAAKTRNESPQKPTRSRCFVQEETSQADIKPQSRPHYVQAAAHSILCQKHARLRMSGKSTLPNPVTTTDTNLPTSTSALDEQMDGLSFSDESVGDSQIGLQASDQSSTLEDIYLPSDPRFEVVSDSTDDSLSESEAESARLVREILSRYKAKTV